MSWCKQPTGLQRWRILCPHDFDRPEHYMLVALEHWQIMRHRVSIRRHSPVGSKILIAPSFKLHIRCVLFRHPFKRRIGFGCITLRNLLPRRSQQKCIIRSMQVKIVYTFEPNSTAFWNKLNAPNHPFSILALLLRDTLEIGVRPQISARVR